METFLEGVSLERGVVKGAALFKRDSSEGVAAYEGSLL